MKFTLWTSHKIDPVQKERFPTLIAYRTQLEFCVYNGRPTVYLTNQYLTNMWHECWPMRGFAFVKKWVGFGSNHAWYDGEHCYFSLGFFEYFRDGVACKRCTKP